MPFQRPKRPAFAIDERPPHPATVAQPKPAFPALSARPPHPATVLQTKTVLAPQVRPPPHPATLLARPESMVLQRMIKKKKEVEVEIKKKKYKDFVALLRMASGIQYEKLKFLIVSLTLDDDHASLYTDSVKAYGDRGTVLNPDEEITYASDSHAVNGNTPKTVFAGGKKPILVITAHGNLQWLLGKTPGNEDSAGQTFCTQFAAWLQQAALQLGLNNLVPTVASTFSAIVLDACWSGSEPLLENYKINVDCCARTLSRLVNPVPVIGFNGKTLNSVSITFYTDSGLSKHRSVDYAANALVFVNGQCVENTGEGEEHHHSTGLLGNDYYPTWLGYIVYNESYATK